jgi:FtsP/CotA-like multicopper oxidase with cupredoxin domain
MLHLGARLAYIALFAALHICAFAQGSGPCSRFPAGSAITAPQDLFSERSVLRVDLTYQTTVDQNGNTLYCFMTASRSQSPTLHVRRGDRLHITLTNNVPVSSDAMAMPGMAVSGMASDTCGAVTMTASSVNIHYHGTNTPPTCHQDEVIRTLVNSGETFQYDLQFPRDEPPGLYWYHPNVHGISEAAVLGGASGALIVEGIQTSTLRLPGCRSRF